MLDMAIRRIPYREFDALAKLVEAHLRDEKNKLRAAIAFGDILTDETSYDIDLLEVFDAWQGSHYAELDSSAGLPLRGKLRLYFLSSEEFENPNSIKDEARRNRTKELLRIVRQAREVIVSSPLNYVESELSPAKYLQFDAPESDPKASKITDPYDLSQYSIRKPKEEIAV